MFALFAGGAVYFPPTAQTTQTFQQLQTMLYLIGLGLSDETDITVKGLEIVRKASRVYLEAYTSILLVDKTILVCASQKPDERKKELTLMDSRRITMDGRSLLPIGRQWSLVAMIF